MVALVVTVEGMLRLTVAVVAVALAAMVEMVVLVWHITNQRVVQVPMVRQVGVRMVAIRLGLMVVEVVVLVSMAKVLVGTWY